MQNLRYPDLALKPRERDGLLKTALAHYPMVSATAIMIHQLALDLYECVGAVWAVVAARTVQKLVPLCRFGDLTDLDASLHCTASILSCDRDAMIELRPAAPHSVGSGPWTPQIVCPTFIRNEMAGALIFGPKAKAQAYTIEEKELVLEFACHISKLLHKDLRAGNRPAALE
jgi:hypothetical protein